jgi:hypothetical protein
MVRWPSDALDCRPDPVLYRCHVFSLCSHEIIQRHSRIARPPPALPPRCGVTGTTTTLPDIISRYSGGLPAPLSYGRSGNGPMCTARQDSRSITFPHVVPGISDLHSAHTPIQRHVSPGATTPARHRIEASGGRRSVAGAVHTSWITQDG